MGAINNTLSSLLQSLFRHKAWVNEGFHAELAKVDAATHPSERHTAIRLLNHIHIVDRIFAAHLTGQPHGFSATNTTETPTLDALRDAVVTCDGWFIEYAGALTSQALEEPIDFVFTDGANGRMTRAEMLAHVATHGSYHRGEVGRILTQVGVPPPRDLYTVFLHQAEPQRRVRA
jgi:uncharacterized damage-inducible protein DinB